MYIYFYMCMNAIHKKYMYGTKLTRTKWDHEIERQQGGLYGMIGFKGKKKNRKLCNYIIPQNSDLKWAGIF